MNICRLSLYSHCYLRDIILFTHALLPFNGSCVVQILCVSRYTKLHRVNNQLYKKRIKYNIAITHFTLYNRSPHKRLTLIEANKWLCCYHANLDICCVIACFSRDFISSAIRDRLFLQISRLLEIAYIAWSYRIPHNHSTLSNAKQVQYSCNARITITQFLIILAIASAVRGIQILQKLRLLDIAYIALSDREPRKQST